MTNIRDVTAGIITLLQVEDIAPEDFAKFIQLAQADIAEQTAFAKRFLIQDLLAMGYPANTAQSVASDVAVKPTLFESLIQFAFDPHGQIQALRQRRLLSPETRQLVRQQLYHRSAMSYTAYLFDQTVDCFKVHDGLNFSDEGTALRHEVNYAARELPANSYFYWDRITEVTQYQYADALPADLQGYRLLVPFINHYWDLAGQAGWPETRDLLKSLCDVITAEHFASLASEPHFDPRNSDPYFSLVEDASGHYEQPYTREAFMAKHMLYNVGYFMVAANLYFQWKYDSHASQGRSVRDLMRDFPRLTPLVHFHQLVVRMTDDGGDLLTDITRQQPSSILEALKSDEFANALCQYGEIPGSALFQYQILSLFETLATLCYTTDDSLNIEAEVNCLLRQEFIPGFDTVENEFRYELLSTVLPTDRQLTSYSTLSQQITDVRIHLQQTDIMQFEKLLSLVTVGAKANSIYHDIVAQAIGRMA